jgi:KGK domain
MRKIYCDLFRFYRDSIASKIQLVTIVIDEVYMEDNFQLEQIDRDDVLEFSSGNYRIAKAIDKIKKVFLSDLCQNFYSWLNQQDIKIDPLNDNKKIDPTTWFDRGIDCEVLKVGAKGRR